MWGDDLTHAREDGGTLENAIKIVEGLNAASQGKLIVKHSTMKNYFDSVHQESKEKSIKYDVATKDFWRLNHWKTKNAFWSGYYSTYPEFKHQVMQFTDFV